VIVCLATVLEYMYLGSSKINTGKDSEINNDAEGLCRSCGVGREARASEVKHTR
jgi:hypothetical protein